MAKQSSLVMSLLTLFLLPASGHSQSSEAPFKHGTVNVILANSNGLVAATDSMLSSSQYPPRIPNGTKLFKLDERTIATMAGLYDISSPEDGSALEFDVRRVMNEFGERAVDAAHDTVEQKALWLFSRFEFVLTSAVQSNYSANRNVSYLDDLYLMVAGYDPDGFLRVAQSKFSYSSDKHGVSYIPVKWPLSPGAPPCERFTQDRPQIPYTAVRLPDMRIKAVDGDLFCAVAGLPETAERALLKPSGFPPTPPLETYDSAKQKNQPLSLHDLRTLAVELVRQTTLDEENNKHRRVGGSVQIAVLSGGKVSKFVSNPLAEKPPDYALGVQLSAPQAHTLDAHCSSDLPGSSAVSGGTGQIQGTITGCSQVLDDYLFHDTTFTNSQLIYRGSGKLRFPTTNTIIKSTLYLGPHVNIQAPDVKRLICDFKWDAVSQAEQNIKCSSGQPVVSPK